MSSRRRAMIAATGCVVGLWSFSGCESEGGSAAAQSGGGYYGSDSYDLYYHGDYDDPDNIATIPPGSRPDAPPRPAHPIALPSAPRAQRLPSIPARPRMGARR
jgi:hypothetical protein